MPGGFKFSLWPWPPLWVYNASNLQVLLDEARTEVNVELYQRRITNRLEAMDLTGLDDKDISRAALEGFAVHRPHSPAFSDKLDLVIRVSVRTRARTGLPMEQEHRNAGIALLNSNKLMRTTDKRQILLAYVMHPLPPLPGLDECGHDPVPRRTPVAPRQISEIPITPGGVWPGLNREGDR